MITYRTFTSKEPVLTTTLDSKTLWAKVNKNNKNNNFKILETNLKKVINIKQLISAIPKPKVLVITYKKAQLKNNIQIEHNNSDPFIPN